MANRKTTISGLKLAAVGAAGLLTSANLAALGLGSLDVQSNLDQPLNGVIEMRVAAGDDISSIKASIASKEDFEDLGIDYPSYLSNLTITVENFGSDNVLRVVSNDVVIKEPFIHFLVRVDWAGGSFLREYTALIDPPVYASETPQSIAQPKAVGTDQSYQTQDTDLEVEDLDQTDSADEVVESAEEDAIEASDPDFAVDSVADEPVNTRSLDNLPTDAQYGPVTSGESLSVIASELQRQFPDLSIYQIMQVLFQENRDAFIGDNINGLRKGSVLNIGDLEAIRAVDVAQSKQFFFDQISEWDPSYIASPSSTGDAGLRVAKDEYDYSADLSDDSSSASIAETAVENFQVGSSSDIVAAVSAAEGDGNQGEVLALQQEITELQSSLSSTTLENRELTERISILEGQLADMNRLVSLNVEDAELANLEATLSDQNDAAPIAEDDSLVDADQASTEEVTVDATSIDDLVGEYLSEDSGELADAGSEDVLTLSDELVDDGSEYVDPASDVSTTDDQGLVSNLEVVSEDVIAEESKPAVVTKPEPSLMEKIKTALIDDGLWKVLAGTGAVLLAGIMLLVFRRRRADEEFEISMLSIETQSQSVNNESVATAVAGTDDKSPDRETSFLTVYSDSDAVVQADEVDPIAEADVYIAYGRDEQAEEVLLDGIASKPERVDIKQKLLGLYHKNNNAEGFERIAEELYSQKNQLTSKVWQAVSLMGKDLAPENPLFDVSSAELLADELPEGDLTSVAAEDGADGVYEIDAKEVKESIESDVDTPSINLVNFDDGRSEISELDDIEINDLDLNIDGSSEDGAQDAGGSEQSLTPDAADEFSMIDVDSDYAESDSTDSESTSVTEPFEDSKAVDFEPDSVEADDDLEAVSQAMSQDLSDLEVDDDYDEARTQYELAKVFVDLGDEDGARKILDELVGNEEIGEDVMSDAKSLLETLES